MTRPDAIVFDLDGTLVHSVPDMQVSLNRVLSAMGRPTLTEDVVKSFVGNGVSQLVARALAATGGADKAVRRKAVGDFLDDYATQKSILTRPYDGVVDCLAELKAQSIPMGVCTNKPQKDARELCDTLGLSQYFGDITGACRDVARKPDPASLLATIAALGARIDATLYIGDSAVDYETAINAKVDFRLYTGGYLNHPLPDLHPAHRFDAWGPGQLAVWSS